MQKLKCDHCGGTERANRGAWFQCKKCKKYQKPDAGKMRLSVKGEKAEMEAFVHERVMNEKDAIRACNIDTTEWAVDRWTCGVDEGWRKDRSVEWVVRDGEVLQGDVHDTGKIIAKPVYRVKLWLVRKTDEIHARKAVDDILADLRKHSPKVARIKYPKAPENLIYEIDFPDLHFGRLAWAEESGKDYDVKIARKTVQKALARLLSYADKFKISKVLLPVGNDWFNVDNKHDTTVNGTPQQEDTRWAKTFRLGRQLACEMIETCMQIAPVSVLIIPGNHDEQRSFYMGDSLDCYFRNNQNVEVDNKANKRKYKLYGTNLIGFTHGDYENVDQLPSIMATEVPLLWGKSKVREWHIAHIHKKKSLELRIDEKLGVTIRVQRSLAPADTWTHDHGFVGSVKAAEGFLWHPSEGLVAQFTAIGE